MGEHMGEEEREWEVDWEREEWILAAATCATILSPPFLYRFMPAK